MFILYYIGNKKTTLLNYNIVTKRLQNQLKMLQIVTIFPISYAYI